MEIFMTNLDWMALPVGIIILLVWTIVWKAIGLWNAARKNHLIMFILMMILNTAGILPIAYLLYLKFSNENKVEQVVKKKTKKRKVGKKSN